MQWESCLACSHLHFRYLVPENVKQLFLLSSCQLTCMPGHLNTSTHQDYLEHMCHAGVHASCMPNVMSLGFAYGANHIIMTSLAFAFHSCHVGMRWHDLIGVGIA